MEKLKDIAYIILAFMFVIIVLPIGLIMHLIGELKNGR